MNKLGCLLFSIVIVIASVIVYSISVTIRKTTPPKIVSTQVQEQISSEGDLQPIATDNKQEFTLRQELRPSGFNSVHEVERKDNIPQYKKSLENNHSIKNEQINSPNHEIYQYNYYERTVNNSSDNYKNEQNFIKEDNILNSIKSCNPYSETMKAEYMGIIMDYRLKIDGWKNGKCILNFEANADGVGSGFMSEYGVESSEVSVSAFTPKIRCEFSKAQLMYVGDSILEENSRKNNSGRMLKDPNGITFPDSGMMSASDIKLLDVLIRQKACKIVNWNEFKSIIQEITDFLTF